jgi:two-component system, cell cycle response regulator
MPHPADSSFAIRAWNKQTRCRRLVGRLLRRSHPTTDKFMSSQLFKVLIVAGDRKHLRRLSKFLNTFGYETQQVADSHQAMLLLKTYAPDFLILDGGDDPAAAFSVCRALSGSEDAPGPYTLLLLESPQVRELSAALEVGVDDFLAKPLDYGELLARLRSGARRREFERRYRESSGIDPHTGLPNRTGFCSRLTTHSAAGSDARSGVCILLEVDFNRQICSDQQWLLGRDLLREVAAKLLECCGKDDLAASFGNGRFGVFLPTVSEDEALAWSERLRYVLNDIEFDFDGAKRRVTASLGMAAVAGEECVDPETALQKASEALLVAQRSGYNYVADWRECDAEAKAWAELAAPGVIFERTTARDVMTPSTRALRLDDSLDHAKRSLHQLQIGMLPVVNAGGILQGALMSDALLEHDSAAASRVRDLMTRDVKQFEEAESLERLKEFFAKESRQFAFVVRHGRPTGWVTPHNLLALGTLLNADSFGSEKVDYRGSRDLQVADI